MEQEQKRVNEMSKNYLQSMQQTEQVLGEQKSQRVQERKKLQVHPPINLGRPEELSEGQYVLEKQLEGMSRSVDRSINKTFYRPV